MKLPNQTYAISLILLVLAGCSANAADVEQDEPGAAADQLSADSEYFTPVAPAQSLVLRELTGGTDAYNVLRSNNAVVQYAFVVPPVSSTRPQIRFQIASTDGVSIRPEYHVYGPLNRTWPTTQVAGAEASGTVVGRSSVTFTAPANMAPGTYKIVISRGVHSRNSITAGTQANIRILGGCSRGSSSEGLCNYSCNAADAGVSTCPAENSCYFGRCSADRCPESACAGQPTLRCDPTVIDVDGLPIGINTTPACSRVLDGSCQIRCRQL